MLVLAGYLAAITALGGPALSRAWEAGGHATPEQLAYHWLLVRLGVPHHHGPADAGAPEDTGVRLLAAQPGARLLPGMTFAPALSVESAIARAVTPSSIEPPPARAGTHTLDESPAPRSVSTTPPHAPPRPALAPTV